MPAAPLPSDKYLHHDMLTRLLLTATLLWVQVTSAAAADDSPVRADLARTQREMERLARSAEAQQATRDAAQEALARAERAALAAQRTLRETQARSATRQRQLQSLEAQQRAHEADLGGQRAALAATLRNAYLERGQDSLKLLLNVDEPARVARALAYRRYSAQARARELERLRGELAVLTKGRAAISAAQDQLARLKSTQQQEQARLDQARKDRAQALAQARTQLGDTQAQAERARADQARLSTLLAGIERAQQAERVAARAAAAAARRRAAETQRQAAAARAKSPARAAPAIAAPPPQAAIAPPATSGRIIPPPQFASFASGAFSEQRGRLPWPVAGRLAARYGQARESGRTHWQGALIAAAPGTQVRSVYPGRVVFADALRGFGLLVIVDHGGGYMTLYGYNGALVRQAGEMVRAGDPLAAVGDGLARPTGAYFEIRRRGAPQDPAVWCRG